MTAGSTTLTASFQTTDASTTLSSSSPIVLQNSAIQSTVVVVAAPNGVGSGPVSITGATESGDIVTITTSAALGLSAGQYLVVSGISTSGYNGSWVAASISSDGMTITYTAGSGLTTPATGLTSAKAGVGVTLTPGADYTLSTDSGTGNTKVTFLKDSSGNDFAGHTTVAIVGTSISATYVVSADYTLGTNANGNTTVNFLTDGSGHFGAHTSITIAGTTITASYTATATVAASNSTAIPLVFAGDETDVLAQGLSISVGTPTNTFASISGDFGFSQFTTAAPVSITAASESATAPGTTVSITTSTALGPRRRSGSDRLPGIPTSGYNGTWVIGSVSPDGLTITYTAPSGLTTPATVDPTKATASGAITWRSARPT